MLMKVSTMAAPRAAVATLVPFSPIHGLGSLRILYAVAAPAWMAVRSPAANMGLPTLEDRLFRLPPPERGGTDL